MTKPTLVAYVVVEPKEGTDKKAFWHKVGSVWPHKSGPGFDLVIPPGLSLSGRIVCVPPKDESADVQPKAENVAA